MNEHEMAFEVDAENLNVDLAYQDQLDLDLDLIQVHRRLHQRQGTSLVIEILK